MSLSEFDQAREILSEARFSTFGCPVSYRANGVVLSEPPLPLRAVYMRGVVHSPGDDEYVRHHVAEARERFQLLRSEIAEPEIGATLETDSTFPISGASVFKIADIDKSHSGVTDITVIVKRVT